ncbi:MAG: hypothetical protein ABEK04_06245 [Candidatus Nanohalobium sp.]
MDMTETSFVPHWAFLVAPISFFAIGLYLFLTTGYPHSLALWIWGIWIIGIGYEKQGKWRADVMKEG